MTVQNLVALQQPGPSQAMKPLGVHPKQRLVGMAVDELAQLRVSRHLLDTKGGAEVVALYGLLKAPLKIKQRRVLQEEHREAAQIAVPQAIGDLAGLSLVGDKVDVAGQAVAKREKSKRVWSSPTRPSHVAESLGKLETNV